MAESDIYTRVKMRFDEKQNKAARERMERIAAVRSRYPRIGELDTEIDRLGMENMMKIAMNPDMADELNSALRQKYRQIEKEKADIIAENHIEKSYDKYLYECCKCSDTGYTPDGGRCFCFEQAIIDEAFPRDLSILENERFENFDIEFYPEEARDAMRKIFGRAKRLCDNFDKEKKGLFFIGAPGLGKTFLSNCIEGELRKSSRTVMLIRAVKLFRLMEDIKFGREEDGEKIRCVNNADLLIIDDLGTENDSQMNSSFFDDILNERINLGKKTVISTNYSMEELNARYSSRFISRLKEFFIISRFMGHDIRMMKI